ncbi:MAG: sulfate adenylyltransferase [Thermoleophilia bacterium]|nr:sulfate adenylyltransferase [Thermoleophilia bacterium]
MPLETPMLHAVAVGSVDDGKSTLIGRLLYETGNLTADEIAAVEEASRKRGRTGIDLALLTDGLRAEREQGITIDVAYRSFDANGRRILLGDAPGHEQYTRNMVTAAAGADVAILLVDAKNGITSQTRRHLAICAMLGVHDVLACVNKMDLVDYDEARFDEITGELLVAATAVKGPRITSIPLSALEGVNLVERSDATPWYTGPTVLQVLHDLDPKVAEDAFRMPVQWVIRHDDGGANIRGLAGRISSGTVTVGDEVIALPSRATSRISRIDMLGRDYDSASAPLSVTLHLADDVDVSRGDVIAPVAAAPQVTSRVRATVAWLDEKPLVAPSRLEARQGNRLVPVIVEEMNERLELTTMEHVPADTLAVNDLGIVTLHFAQPIAVEPYAENRELGSMVLVDPSTNRTVAAVMVTEVLEA